MRAGGGKLDVPPLLYRQFPLEDEQFGYPKTQPTPKQPISDYITVLYISRREPESNSKSLVTE
jgi:hypothetical protein